MKKVLVTGANGLIGTEFCHTLKKEEEYQVIPTLHHAKESEISLDVTNPFEVNQIVDQIKPDIILHCAAYTDVDRCEIEQERAFCVNVDGTKIVAEAAKRIGAVFVHFSTDYIFDGNRQLPYTEQDLPHPISIYAKTKYESEQIVKQIGGEFLIIRSGWIFGLGKNFVKTILNLAEVKKEIKVVNDQRGTPTSAKEVVRAVQFLLHTKQRGVFHATCEGEVSWYEYACEIFRYCGCSVSVFPITTKEYHAKAHRPAYSVLKNQRLEEQGFFLADWQSELKTYLKQEGKLAKTAAKILRPKYAVEYDDFELELPDGSICLASDFYLAAEKSEEPKTWAVRAGLFTDSSGYCHKIPFSLVQNSFYPTN